MLELILAQIVLVGILVLEGLIIGGLMHWRQLVTQQQERDEEENLTPYPFKENSTLTEQLPQDGFGMQPPRNPRLLGWEYKIVRANGNIFRNPAIFQKLCEEEAQAGWILLEKLDNRRVRFKRPIAMRQIIKTELLSFDPYRCHYGPLLTSRGWLAAIAIAIAMMLPAYVGYGLVSALFANQNSSPSTPPAQQLPSSERSP